MLPFKQKTMLPFKQKRKPYTSLLIRQEKNLRYDRYYFDSVRSFRQEPDQIVPKPDTHHLHAVIETRYRQVVQLDTEVTFSGGASTDDGRITDYEWTFGDGNTGTGIVTNHTYTEVGQFNVTLKVTDDFGATEQRNNM